MSMPRWLYGFLQFSVLSVLLRYVLVVPPLLLFIVACLGIIPLAGIVGQSVERIAERTGEVTGGLLLATFGNAADLIIGIFALMQGLVDVVRASIIGAILCNVLLVLGLATCVGGVKHGRLQFEKSAAGQYSSLLTLCIAGLVLPAIAELFTMNVGQQQLTARGIVLSDVIAVLLLTGYLLSILFAFFRTGDREQKDQVRYGLPSKAGITRLHILRAMIAHGRHHPSRAKLLDHLDTTMGTLATPDLEEASSTFPPASSEEKEQDVQASALSKPTQERKPRLLPAFVLLTVATVGIAWLSGILVDTIQPLTVQLRWSPAFIGLVFLPLISTIPEYVNTSRMALEKRMGMVLAATAGSSIQIALLVAPVLVLVSLFTQQHLGLVFSFVSLAALGLGTFLYTQITQDGDLVWLEGGLLILIYVMMGATVFLF